MRHAKHLPAALLLWLSPMAAGAETLTCTLATMCNTDSATCNVLTAEDSPSFQLVIAEDGKTARLYTSAEGLELTVLDQGPLGRSFLLKDGDSGVGVLTLTADGALAAVTNEMNMGGLIGTAARGQCAVEKG